MKITKTNKKYLYTFVALFFLSLLFVPTGDDWNRIIFNDYTFNGMYKLIKYHYLNLNGRILGNLLSYLLINPIAASLSKSITLTIIIYFLEKISGLRKNLAFVCSFFFVLAVPRLIFIQVYSWTSGFFNYIPPILMFLYYFYCLKKEINKETFFNNRYKWIYPFLIIISCLFVEHISIFLLIFPLLFLIIQKIKGNKVSKFFIIFPKAALIGNIILFSSPVYRKILTVGDNYRNIPSTVSFFNHIIENYKIFSKYFLFSSPLFLILFFILLYFYFIQNKTKNIIPLFGITLYILVSRLFLYNILTINIKINKFRTYFILLDFLSHLIFIYLIYDIRKDIESKNKKTFYQYLILALPILNGPLLIVQPVLARNYYANYIILVILFLIILDELLLKKQIPYKFTITIFSFFTLSIYIFYIIVFSGNKISFYKRIKTIEEEMARRSEKIIIEDFHFPLYIFGPKDMSLGNKYYYEKTKDIEFILESEFED